MAAKLTSTKTTYRVALTTKVLFIDEYDPDYRLVPTEADVFVADGKLDKIEMLGDDPLGFQTVALIRDRGRLSAVQQRVVAQILAACDVKA